MKIRLSETLKTPRFWLILAYTVIFILPVIMLFSSSDEIENAQSLCPVKMLTGLPCPSCGMTKSVLFLFRGEWSKSFSYHLFGPILVAMMAFYPTTKGYPKFLFKHVRVKPNLINKIGYGFIALFMLYYLYRLVVFIRMHSGAEIIHESIWK